MRYAVRPKQISDSVLCQRSAIVIGTDAFRSTSRNVFHTAYDARGDSNAVIEPRLFNQLPYFRCSLKGRRKYCLVDKMGMINRKIPWYNTVLMYGNYGLHVTEQSPLLNFESYKIKLAIVTVRKSIEAINGTLVSSRRSQWLRQNQWPRSILTERNGNVTLRNGSHGCTVVSVATDAISWPMIDACSTPPLSLSLAFYRSWESLKGYYSLSIASDYWSNTRKRGEKTGMKSCDAG